VRQSALRYIYEDKDDSKADSKADEGGHKLMLFSIALAEFSPANLSPITKQ
jgi:hypothetical protein